MIQISPEEFTRAMRLAVQERGEDYIYPMERDEWQYAGLCRYVVPAENGGEQAGCLIGLAMFKAGVPLEDMKPYEGRGAYALMTGLARVPSWVIAGAGEAQGVQDDGSPWGEALKAYLRRIESR